MTELGVAWCNEVQFAKLIAVARAAQNMMEWENIKREDTLRGLELTSIVDPYCSDIHSTCEALDKALVSLEEEEDEVKVLEKALVALDTTLHRSDEIRREIDDLEYKIDDLERELERETGDCEGFAID